jgi:hypothetical protein
MVDRNKWKLSITIDVNVFILVMKLVLHFVCMRKFV